MGHWAQDPGLVDRAGRSNAGAKGEEGTTASSCVFNSEGSCLGIKIKNEMQNK